MNRGFTGALCLSVTFVLLAGCGGSSSPGALPQGRANVQRAGLGESWMLPKASRENLTNWKQVARPDREDSQMSPTATSIKTLLYISDFVTNDVFVYNYDTGTSVGKLTGFDWPAGQCVDAKGNVWITSILGNAVYEFSHGGRKPIKKLKIYGSAGCSIDPTTGDLAVVTNPGSPINEVFIFSPGGGKPTIYSNADCYFLLPPGYDDKGNLYVEGQGRYGGYGQICEIPHNGKKLETITANVKLYSLAGVMWDGKHITLADRKYDGKSGTAIYQMAQSKPGQLKEVGSTVLSDCGGGDGVFQPFLVGTENTPLNKTLAVAVVGAYASCQNRFDYWKYPKGGNPVKSLKSPPDDAVGQSVSIAQPSKKNSLLYVSVNGTRTVHVFSYPKGKPKQVLTGFGGPAGECVDRPGNVFITDVATSGAGYVYEYAHGGSTPIATLNDPFTFPNGCAVDPKSGDLALVSNGGLAIYPEAGGTPTTYLDESFQTMRYAGYDDAHNLFIDGDAVGGGFALAELPSGSNQIIDLSISGPFRGAGAVQWDGSNMTVETLSFGVGRHGPALIYRLQISGSSATIVGTTELVSSKNRYNGGQFWIQGNRVIGPDKSGNAISFWNYPAGGKPTKSIADMGPEAWGVTVSSP